MTELTSTDQVVAEGLALEHYSGLSSADFVSGRFRIFSIRNPAARPTSTLIITREGRWHSHFGYRNTFPSVADRRLADRVIRDIESRKTVLEPFPTDVVCYRPKLDTTGFWRKQGLAIDPSAKQQWPC